MKLAVTHWLWQEVSVTASGFGASYLSAGIPSLPLRPLVQQLADGLGGESPLLLDVTPHPDCAPAQCFANVNRLVGKLGGSLVPGWAVWDWPGFYVRAEHHAVWLLDGTLRDPTSREDGQRRVLFVPDPAATPESERSAIRLSRWLAEPGRPDADWLTQLSEAAERMRFDYVRSGDEYTEEAFAASYEPLERRIEGLIARMHRANDEWAG